MKRLLLTVLLGLSLTLIGCGEADTSTTSDVDVAEIGDPAEGRRLFQTGGDTQIPCTSCHTLDGTELVGPTMDGIAQRAATRSDLSAVDYLRQSIAEPSAYVVEGYTDIMSKQYGEVLTAQEIDDLVAYLLTQ